PDTEVQAAVRGRRPGRRGESPGQAGEAGQGRPGEDDPAQAGQEAGAGRRRGRGRRRGGRGRGRTAEEEEEKEKEARRGRRGGNLVVQEFADPLRRARRPAGR